jgi:hypothetical protein
MGFRGPKAHSNRPGGPIAHCIDSRKNRPCRINGCGAFLDRLQSCASESRTHTTDPQAKLFLALTKAATGGCQAVGPDRTKGFSSGDLALRRDKARQNAGCRRAGAAAALLPIESSASANAVSGTRFRDFGQGFRAMWL